MKLYKVLTIIICMAMITTVGMAQNPMDFQKSMEKLKHETPLTNEKLKMWLPENLSGMERISIKTPESPGVSSIEAIYNTTDEPEFLTTASGGDALNKKNKSISLGIIDGAGPTGSGIVSALVMMNSMPFETEDASKHQKVSTVNGITGQETYRKKVNSTEVQFVYKGRFAVTVKSTHLNPDETWKIIPLLDLEALIR